MAAFVKIIIEQVELPIKYLIPFHLVKCEVNTQIVTISGQTEDSF